MVSNLGHISGGHFNPAITLGFVVTRRIHPVLAGVYWFFQLLGAVCAAFILRYLFTKVSVTLTAPTPNISDGKAVLLEGAHATLLDLDHGTYPFVTSSTTIAGGAAQGIGIGPTRIDEVIGVAKAYVTRVGEGPFPTEIRGPDQERLQELGGEFGTVTGRTRRCGWLDLVGLRYAVRVNGITSLALTKLDVLSAFGELPVCVRYRLRDGTETDEFPAHQSDFHHCEPVYETLPGWQEPLDGGLPPAAARYVEFIEERVEVSVTLVGTGRERERVLDRRAAAA
jgi:adenylosuccinate synthase